MAWTTRRNAAIGAIVFATVALIAAPGHAAVARWSGDHYLNRNADTPVVHVSPAGAAVVSWLAYGKVGEHSRAYAAVRDASGAWTAPKALTGPHDSTGSVWSGIGGRGRAVVVWNIGGTSYWTQRQPGGQWAASRKVPGPAAQSFDMAPNGSAVISYGSGGQAYIRVLDADGAWRSGVRVSSPASTTTRIGAKNMMAVIGDDGAVTATWWEITVDSQSQTLGDWQRGGTSGAGSRLPVVTIDSQVHEAPLITKSTSGDSVAIYSSDAGVPHAVTFRLADGGWHNWSVPAPHEPGIGRLTPVLGSDRFSVFWIGASRAGGTTIYVEDYAGGAWSGPTVVHHRPTGAMQAGGLGLVAAMSSNERLVAWTDGDAGDPRRPHVTTLRDRRDAALTQYTFGAESTADSLAAAGGHAAFAWVGGPSGLGLRVRTR